jgi:hypothetical protein
MRHLIPFQVKAERTPLFYFCFVFYVVVRKKYHTGALAAWRREFFQKISPGDIIGQREGFRLDTVAPACAAASADALQNNQSPRFINSAVTIR